MNYIILIMIFITHWVADFVFQTEEMGLGKSKSVKMLLKHIGVYSFFFFIPWFWLILITGHPQYLLGLAWFNLMTIPCHFTTDYFTSKQTSKFYAQGKFYGWPGFWPMIGLDQALHSIQLVISWLLFFNSTTKII